MQLTWSMKFFETHSLIISRLNSSASSYCVILFVLFGFFLFYSISPFLELSPPCILCFTVLKSGKDWQCFPFFGEWNFIPSLTFSLSFDLCFEKNNYSTFSIAADKPTLVLLYSEWEKLRNANLIRYVLSHSKRQRDKSLPSFVLSDAAQNFDVSSSNPEFYEISFIHDRLAS